MYDWVNYGKPIAWITVNGNICLSKSGVSQILWPNDAGRFVIDIEMVGCHNNEDVIN